MLPLTTRRMLTTIMKYIAPTVLITGTTGGTNKGMGVNLLVRVSLMFTTLSAFLRLCKGGVRLKSKLPIVVNMDFTCIPAVATVTTRTRSIGAVFNTVVMNNVMTVVIKLAVGRVEGIFPPLMVKAIVFTVNLSLCGATVGCVTKGSTGACRIVMRRENRATTLICNS